MLPRVAIVAGTGVALTAALAAGGPVATARTPAFRAASYEEIPCPAVVIAHAVGSVRCGNLTVPESRRVPTARPLRLFVVRERPAGDVPPDPVLALWELGLARSWATSDALPTAVRREVITMDPRGLGRSEPSLACPEVERLVPASLGAPSEELRTRRLLLRAVGACRARLVRHGIDPSAFSLAEAAADAEDLREALGIERWNLGGYGSGARLAFEILRRDDEHVRSLYLDSPEAPQTDLLTTAILGTRAATSRLAAACRAQSACNRRFPRLARSLARTLERRERRPLRLRAGHRGRTIPVALDGGTTLRALRETIATDPRRAPLAFAAGDGALRSARQDWIAERPAFTLGYAVHEGDTFTFSHGPWFSTVCRDQLAFVSQQALRRLTVGAPAFREAFAESPLHAICRVWHAGRAVAAPTRVASSVPTLAFVGRFDPYGPEAPARSAAARLSRSWVVADPSWAYNVMHEPCAHSMRNGWLDAPESPPDTRCLARLRPLRFALR